jgi:TolA-binding protein
MKQKMSALALGVALAVGIGSLAIAPEPAHAQWVVFDPANFSQNILTALRALESNLHEIKDYTAQLQQIQNQVTGLANDARNLKALPQNIVSQYQQALQGFQQQVQQTQGLMKNLANVRTQFGQQYPTQAGGATVQAALPEIRELAERGVVDGVTWPWDIFVIKADSILKYHMDAPFYITAQAHVINKDFYNALDAEQKAVIDSHCTPEWSEKVNAGWAKGEIAAREKLKNLPDHHVYGLTAEQLGVWKKAAEPLRAEVFKTVKGRYGLDPDAVYSGLTTKLKANDALY